MKRRRFRLARPLNHPRETLIHLAGPLDRWGVVRMRFKLLVRLARGCSRVVLDLRKVPYIDSDGIKALRGLRDDWQDVRVELINANSDVRRTLRLSRVEDLLAEAAGEPEPAATGTG
jgi:anti-anti-sigma factor